LLGTLERFHCGNQLASYVGLVPTEESSGERRRLGHISKQGNVLLRFLLVEAAQVTVRSQQEWRSKFFHLAMRRGRKIAKVAMARKLAPRAEECSGIKDTMSSSSRCSAPSSTYSPG